MIPFTLQTGWLDWLTQGVVGSELDDTAQAGFGILGFIMWAVIIIVVIVGGYLALKLWGSKFSYEGEDAIAPYAFHWMSKYGTVEGNLSHNDSFDEEVMINIEQHSDLKMFPDIIRHMIKQKKINVYNFKMTDEGQATDDLDRKVRIISPIDLTSLEVAWEDQKGKRNIMSIVRREKRRNVVFYHTSQRIEIVDEDGNIEDWWIVSPVPMTEAKRIIGFDSNAIAGAPTHFIEVLKLEGGRALATLASLSPIISEAIAKYQHAIAERDTFHNMYEEGVLLLEEANMKVNDLKNLLTQKKYVDFGAEEILQKAQMNFGWLIGVGVITYVMMKLMPRLLQGYIEQDLSEIIGMAVAIFIIGLVWQWYTEKQKTLEEKIKE